MAKAKAKRRTRPTSKNLDVGAGDVPRSFKRSTDGDNYTRIEAKVPMRDGVKLNTIIFVPKAPAKKKPILLTRTPYSAGGRSGGTSPDVAMVLSPSDEHLLRDGYIRAFQDVRGRFGSKGSYTMTMPVRGPFNKGKVDQVTDAWDTVEWLVHNVEGNNGRVGIKGTSYDGLLTLMALLDPHPALKAAVPVNAMVDSWMGDDFYRHGALRVVMLDYMYRQTATTNASQKIAWGSYDSYTAVLEAGNIRDLGKKVGADKLPAWKRILEHAAYDEYWQDQALDRQLAKAPRRVPVLTVHSLFDQEDIYGPPASHAAMAAKDKSGTKTHLVIGPWCHGQESGEGASLGALRWDADTSLQFRREVLKPFLDQHLKGVKPAKATPKVRAFVTGANRWEDHAAWPPPKAKTRKLYLQPGGGLGFQAPARVDEGAGDGFTEYVSDPAKPVPYRVRPIPAPFAGGPGVTWSRWLVDDQRPFSDRPDVLVFVGGTLDEPLTVSGEVAATLFASTTGSDADWVVKLIDLYPDEMPGRQEMGGYQLMIAGDILRGRYRESFSQAAPIPPGEVLPYRVPMPHVNHTFLPGHRVMVQVQSTWFPLYDRNPQTFVRDVWQAKPGDFVKATHRVHHARGAASFVELPVRR